MLGAVNPIFIKSAEAAIRIHSRANCFANVWPGYVTNESITWDDTFTSRMFKTQSAHYENWVYKHVVHTPYLFTWNNWAGDITTDWNKLSGYGKSWYTSGVHWIKVAGINRWLGSTSAGACFSYGWGSIVYVPGL